MEIQELSPGQVSVIEVSVFPLLHAVCPSPPGSPGTIQCRESTMPPQSPEAGDTPITLLLSFSIFCFLVLLNQFALSNFFYRYKTCLNTNRTADSAQFTNTFLVIQFPGALCDVKQGPHVPQNKPDWCLLENYRRMVILLKNSLPL